MAQRTTQDNIELVVTGWLLPVRRRDIQELERHLHANAVWQAANGEIGCGNRNEILAMIGGEIEPLLGVDRLDLLASGDRVVVGVRSDELDEVAGVPLDGQLFFVITIEDDRIVRIEDQATRSAALATAGIASFRDWQ
jgi:ketosteroid isomerase-like protein